MPTYHRADAEVLSLVADVMRRFHGGLAAAGVMIDVLMAHPTEDDNGDTVGHAITVHGYPAAACVKVLAYKDRVKTGCDAELMLDDLQWDTSTWDEQVAVVDHELTHLELIVDARGNVRRDDAERPRLRMRKHDRHFGWFDLVAHRHGEHSLEVRQAREMVQSDQFKQCYLFDLDGPDRDLSVEISARGQTVKTTVGALEEFAGSR